MKTSISIDPPIYALRLFRWYCRSDRLEELEGDLLEMHEHRKLRIQSPAQLKIHFWWDVIMCFKRYSINKTQLKMNSSLYQSFFKIAIRNAWKHKGPVFTNVIGMSLALGFCITVYMIHAYNLEFDTFFKNTDNIVRIHSLKMDNGMERRYELAPLPLVSQLKNDVAGVQDVVSYETTSGIVQMESDYFTESMAYASSNFINFFEFPLASGNSSSFKDPNTIFLSKELAGKYYGTSSAIGELLTLFIGDNYRLEVQVGGVFEKIPMNTSFDFDILFNMDAYLLAKDRNSDDWKNTINAALYVKTTDPTPTERALAKTIPLQNEMQESWKISRFELLPFVDERIADHIVDYGPANMRIRPQALIIFTVLGILILLIACFNMANSAMALIGYRVKEVGIRKTLGSKNRQIFFQFLFEMFTMMSISLILAMFLSNIIATQLWGPFGLTFFIQDISIINLIPFLITFAFACTIIAGLLPAFYAWKFQPVSILNNNSSLKGVGWIQKIFTVGQYTFSIAVLILGWTFVQNSDYLKNLDIGLNYKGLLMIPMENANDYEKLKNKIEQLTYVSKVVGTDDHHEQSRSRGVITLDTGKVEVSKFDIGYNYLSTMEIKVMEGRNFFENSESDKSEAIIVNQAFGNLFFPDTDPLHKAIKLDDEWRTIVGVTKDVIYNLYEDYEPRPEVYRITEESNYKLLLVKVENANTDEVEVRVKEIWADTFDKPYKGKWQEELTMFFASRDSKSLKGIFLSLAFLGCILCLLGIVSLATLNVRKKTKEICIRKVLGASSSQILLKVNKSFIMILGISLVSGVVLGILLSNSVLNMIYAFHTEVSILYSISFGFLVILATIFSISLAVSKPVNANPSQALANE